MDAYTLEQALMNLSPPGSAAAVVPSDSTVLEVTRGLYIGGSGDIAATMQDGGSVTFVGLLAGVIYPLAVIKVKAASTATNIVALR